MEYLNAVFHESLRIFPPVIKFVLLTCGILIISDLPPSHPVPPPIGLAPAVSALRFSDPENGVFK